MRARTFAVVLVAGLAFDAVPVAADDAAQAGSAEQRFAEVSNMLCFRQAAGQIAFGASVDDDTRLMAEAGLSFGMTSPTLERLGRDGVVLVSQSILGGTEVGGDRIVVAVGGWIPAAARSCCGRTRRARARPSPRC